jgi:hypothetical protein
MGKQNEREGKMKCTNPIEINIKREATKKYGVKPVYVKVRCGRCKACRITKISIWSLKMLFEYATRKGKGYFITLTYDDDNVPLFDWKGQDEETTTVQTLYHKDVQDFIKRMRKNWKGNFSYFVCGEYGEISQRPHYHMLVFGEPHALGLSLQELERTWKMGKCHIGDITTASIRYVCKYMMKETDRMDYKYDPYFTSSKNLGALGMFANLEEIAERGYIINQEGEKVSVPKYFKEKFPELLKIEFDSDMDICKRYGIEIPEGPDGKPDWTKASSFQIIQFEEASKIESDMLKQRAINLEARQRINEKRDPFVPKI